VGVVADFIFFFFCVKLAGVVAVEVSGGPVIPFHPGREVRFLNSLLNLEFPLGFSRIY
jgi:hypothetical protein